MHRFKRDDFQSALVRGLKNDAWSHVVLVGLLPARGAETPAVSGFETGETVFEAARREVLEETNLAVDILGFLDVVDSIVHDNDGRVRFHYTLVEVFAVSTRGDPVAGDDAAEAAWFGLDAISSLDLWPETVRMIRLADERRTLL